MTKKLAFSLVFVFSTVFLSAHTLTYNTQVVSSLKTENFALPQLNSLSCTCEGGAILTGTFVTTLNYFFSLLTAFAAPVFLWFFATKMNELLKKNNFSAITETISFTGKMGK